MKHFWKIIGYVHCLWCPFSATISAGKARKREPNSKSVTDDFQKNKLLTDTQRRNGIRAGWRDAFTRGELFEDDGKVDGVDIKTKTPYSYYYYFFQPAIKISRATGAINLASKPKRYIVYYYFNNVEIFRSTRPRAFRSRSRPRLSLLASHSPHPSGNIVLSQVTVVFNIITTSTYRVISFYRRPPNLANGDWAPELASFKSKCVHFPPRKNQSIAVFIIERNGRNQRAIPVQSLKMSRP